MRHLPRTACAYLAGLFFAAASVPAFADDIGFTIDLLAPATNCVGSVCPSDISLPQLGGVAGATTVSMTGNSSTVTLDGVAAQPIVCSEVKNSSPPYGFGPTGAYEISPVFGNASPGGLFEFDSGGASIVDGSSVSNDGTIFSIRQPNTAGPTPTQVACYPISPVGVTKPQYTTGSVGGDRVFYNAFEGGHVAGEPWVSINTVASPISAQSSVLGYVMQIHNASNAVNWHLSLGYDQAFFHIPQGFVPQWCVLDATNAPQPGAVPNSVPLCGSATSIRTLIASDIQSATNSIYIFVQNFGGSTAVSNWTSMPSTFYPASGAVFAPPGVYAQRIDDKVAVAGQANVPTQNIGNIVCANDPASTSCTLSDQDGNALPSAVTFKNQVSTGAVTIDPVAFVVDPNAMTTLPGTTVSLAAPTNVSCVDPNGIFASPVSATNFAASTGAQGARAFNFNFAPSGALFVPGTAICTATFASNGLSSAQSFTVTMQQLTVTHFTVTADATATAGIPANFTVTAKDGADNTVSSYTGIVKFTSSDGQAVHPANSPLTNGTGSFQATFETSGSQTITATDTVSSTIHGTSNNVAVSADVANKFSVVMLGSATVGVPTGVNITALDQFGNEATSYTGSVVFTSTDGVATLPLPGPLNHGSHGATSVTFLTTGTQTVTVTDGSITGKSNNVVVDN